MPDIRPRVYVTHMSYGLNHIRWGSFRAFCGVEIWGGSDVSPDPDKSKCTVCEQLYKEYRASIDNGDGGYGFPPTIS
jgi:hypothetical protein